LSFFATFLLKTQTWCTEDSKEQFFWAEKNLVVNSKTSHSGKLGYYTNLEQTPLNLCQQLTAPYKRLADNTSKTDKQ